MKTKKSTPVSSLVVNIIHFITILGHHLVIRPQVTTILWLKWLIHFCQGLKQHHILKQDELNNSDLSLVIIIINFTMIKYKNGLLFTGTR